MLSIISTLCIGFTGCSDSPSTNGEWYVCPDGFATPSDFQEIITAIDNHEWLSYRNGKDHYAEIDEFISDDGLYYDSDRSKGRLEDWVQRTWPEIIHIVDDNTVELYRGSLYKDSGKNNKYGEQRIWHFNAGKYFDEMAYYVGNPTNLIYTKKNNTYVFSNGDVYIMKSDGLQGNEGIWKKFTPKF